MHISDSGVRYDQMMDETTAMPTWPTSMLRRYGDMLSVSDVSRVLNMEPRNVRGLLTTVDVSTRLPGVKIGKSWRIARDQLHRYLVNHHNALHHDNAIDHDALHDDALHDDSLHGDDDVAFSSLHDERDS